MKTMDITVFTTGGTIDKVYFDAKGNYAVGEPTLRQILTQARVLLDVDIVEIMRKDSLEMTDDDRRLIADRLRATDCNRVVITHGTDTMVETAAVLRQIAGKTIVMTGSLQPARFSDSDAPFNLGMAFAAVQTLPPGVYITANGQCFDASRVRKNLERNCFESLDQR